MSGSKRVVILVRKLHHGSAELCKVHVDEICKLVAGKDGLLLKDADISPCLYDLGLNVPKCCVTEQIRAVM